MQGPLFHGVNAIPVDELSARALPRRPDRDKRPPHRRVLRGRHAS